MPGMIVDVRIFVCFRSFATDSANPVTPNLDVQYRTAFFALLSGTGGNKDDDTFVSIEHTLTQHLASAQVLAAQIRGLNFIPDSGLGFVDWRDFSYTRIIDEYVDAAPFREDLSDHDGNLLIDANIAGNRQSLNTALFSDARHFPMELLVAEVSAAHVNALLGELFRDDQPDAPGSACHQRCLSV